MTKFLHVLLLFMCQMLPSCSKKMMIVGARSMEPSYMLGDQVKADLGAYKHSIPRRWDVVLFKDLSKGELQILRVIGLPGERIELSHKGILLNGIALATPATMGAITYGPAPTGLKTSIAYPLLVPPDSVFLLGDNSGISYDSRFWGPLPLSNIVGKVIK